MKTQRPQAAANRCDLAALAPRAVAAYDDSVHFALRGTAPEDVEHDAELSIILAKSNAQGAHNNTKIVEARLGFLRAA